MIRGYRRTLQGDRKHLLERFRYVHAARKVVGVGSVGTRAWIILMLGRDNEDPLFLQLKQAEASVLEPFLGKSQYANHGQRVVEGQRLMQAASDIMLGWDRITGPEGVKWDFYMRQLWDNKGSAIIEGMKPSELAAYAEICGQHPGPRARTLRRRGHDQRLPRLKRRHGPGARRLRRALRRSERTRLRRAHAAVKTGRVKAETDCSGHDWHLLRRRRRINRPPHPQRFARRLERATMTPAPTNMALDCARTRTSRAGV